MSTSSPTLKINWSVWDGNPTVNWDVDGVSVSVTMKLPPISVTHLQNRELIAVVGNYDEFGSANLLLYSYDGKLQKTMTAPPLGDKAQFGGVTESAGSLQSSFGFQVDGKWKEEAGLLSLEDGTVTDIHRNY
jgi:hypothetical protein